MESGKVIPFSAFSFQFHFSKNKKTWTSSRELRELLCDGIWPSAINTSIWGTDGTLLCPYYRISVRDNYFKTHFKRSLTFRDWEWDFEGLLSRPMWRAFKMPSHFIQLLQCLLARGFWDVPDLQKSEVSQRMWLLRIHIHSSLQG